MASQSHPNGCQHQIDDQPARDMTGQGDTAAPIRPGIQALMQDAQRGRFDVVLAEALDRISRDQEDVAGVYKRLTFASVKIATLSEGRSRTSTSASRAL